MSFGVVSRAMRASLFGHLGFSLLLVSTFACGGGAAPAPGGTTPTSAGPAGTSKSLGAGPDHPDSDKVTWKKDAPAKNCHTGNKGDGDLVAGVTAMATGCVGSKMKQVGAPMQGEGGGASAGTPGGMIKTLPFKAQANKCYRFFGLAQNTVTDFDISVMDSASKNIAEDLTDSNDAIVLEDGVICFKSDDDISINVAVGLGSGKWAVSVWSD